MYLHTVYTTKLIRKKNGSNIKKPFVYGPYSCNRISDPNITVTTRKNETLLD